MSIPKQTPEDICIAITIENRGPDAADLHVLPTLWFRNTWHDEPSSKPLIEIATRSHDARIVHALPLHHNPPVSHPTMLPLEAEIRGEA